MTYILGINAFHADSAACLLRDGVMLGAAEEERFRRVKHWAGFPTESIRWCLADAGISLRDVEHVALNQDPRANTGAKLAWTLAHRPSVSMLMERLARKRKRASASQHLAGAFAGEPQRFELHAVPHHLAHLSSAFHVSPFEEASIVSVDGFGDFASAAWGIGRGAAITMEGQVLFPHSLGIFYQGITQFLGFPHYGDEYKVMGLAPYGEPLHLEAMRRIVLLQPDGTFKLNLRCFRHQESRIELPSSGGSPAFAALFDAGMSDLLGSPRAPDEPLTQRHKDIARSAQAMYEEAFFHLLNALHVRHGLDAVCIAGGCGMNSVANGKVTLRTPFKRVYVQSAAGDAGGAVGAAYAVWHKLSQSRGPSHDHAYWGPYFGDDAIDEVLAANETRLEDQQCEVVRCDEGQLCVDTAAAIAAGQVVGWFQGRMEWGPRALGNRSILGDPRRADMKDILNLKIKRRESFRPFAPSVLRESVRDWFELDGDVPFMMQVYPIRAEQRSRIPAVTHVDGSGRLQTVTRETNPRYHRLIEAFREITGVPMVLNTSFNENEPVVCTPGEALDCFLRTRMDLLVLGTRMVRRRAA